MRSLILHAVLTGPNSWKVAIVLEELSIPYQIESHSLAEIKEKAFTDRNSNGRVPVLEDPNTGVTVWESGACLEYLIEAYDKDFQLSYTDLKLKFQLKSWMFFQVSGQGPYWGQAACLIFEPWNAWCGMITALGAELESFDMNDYPHFKAWQEKMEGRETVKEVSKMSGEAMARSQAGHEK